MTDHRIRVPYGVFEKSRCVYKGSFNLPPDLYERLQYGFEWAEWIERPTSSVLYWNDHGPGPLASIDDHVKRYHIRLESIYFHGGERWSALVFPDYATLKSFKRYVNKNVPRQRRARQRPKHAFSYVK